MAELQYFADQSRLPVLMLVAVTLQGHRRKAILLNADFEQILESSIVEQHK